MLISNFNVHRLENQTNTKHVGRFKKVIMAANWEEILLKREDEAFRNDVWASCKLLS